MFAIYKTLVLLYLIPVLLLLWLVDKFTVNVPFWDQWQTSIDLFFNISQGKIIFNDFFLLQNEHRLFFPRIIFVILAFASKWNIKIEVFFNIFLGILIFLLLYKISDFNRKNTNDRLFHITNILICYLTFSYSQWENWLWGFQIALFLINVCLIGAIFVITCLPNISLNKRIAIAAILCFIASFSSAHGLLTWLALVPAIIFTKDNLKDKIKITAIWMGLFLISGFIYSIGYVKPGGHPSLSFLLQSPLAGFNYFFSLLGSPLLAININPNISIFIGMIIFVMWIIINLYTYQNHKKAFIQNFIPWFSLGLFVILFDCVTTVGRVGFGLPQSLSSRYTTIGVLLIISLVQISRLFLTLEQSQTIFKISRRVYLFLITLVFITLASSSVNAITILELQTTPPKILGKTCLELIYLFDKKPDESVDKCLQHIFPVAKFVKNHVNKLDQLQFRQFLKEANLITPPPDRLYGFIDSPPTNQKPLIINKNQDNPLTLTGWAALPNTSVKPDLVLLSLNKKKSFFALTTITINRPDVATYLKSPRFTKSGWTINLSPKTLPLGEKTIKAWVYDQENKQFIKLKGEPKILVKD